MLSEDFRQELSSMIAEAESPREKAVDVMLEIQKRHRWMSDEAMEEAAVLLGMTPLELDELATFYDFIYRSLCADAASAASTVASAPSIRGDLGRRI